MNETQVTTSPKVVRYPATAVVSVTNVGGNITWTFNRSVALSGPPAGLEVSEDGSVWRGPNGSATQITDKSIRIPYQAPSVAYIFWRVVPTVVLTAAPPLVSQSGSIT